MRCPFCRQNIRIQGRFCPRCGEQIFGLPVGRPDGGPAMPARTGPPAAPAGGSAPRPPIAPAPTRGTEAASPPDLIDLDVDFDDAGPGPAAVHGVGPAPARPATGAAQVQSADDEYVGKVCPYCRFPIKPGDTITVCSECQVPHHEDCWRENESCTTYGCTGGLPASQSYSRGGPLPSRGGGWSVGGGPPQAATPLGPQTQARVESTFVQHRLRELESRANNALVLSILGFLCFLPALIGFFMGIGVLGQVAQTRALAQSSAHGRAIGAVVVGLFFMIVWGLLVVGPILSGR